MKCKLILTFILSFAMISCSNSQPSDSSILKAIDEGNKIVGALEVYHEKNGSYPESLEDLVPLYLGNIPNAKLKKERKFSYLTIQDKNATENYFGFRLAFYVSNTGILGSRKAKRYIYQPSKIYGSDEYETTIKVVDDWAYQEVQRVYQKR